MNQNLKLLVDAVPPESPLIGLDTDTIDRVVDITENLTDDTFTVSNVGTGTLQYQITDDQTWLSVNPTTGSSTGEADTITVSYDVAGLAGGSYGATIEVSDNGSSPAAANTPQTITVTVNVKSVLPDFDGDGDVDQDDYGFLQLCYTDSGEQVVGACTAADVNSDQMVDASDLAVFQTCVSGADILADKTCDDALE
jgi:hypothetical protein